MCVYSLHVYLCIHEYLVCVRVCINMCTDLCPSVCISVSVSVHVYTYRSISVYIHVSGRTEVGEGLTTDGKQVFKFFKKEIKTFK